MADQTSRAQCATVTNLSTRRRHDDVLHSVTFVLGGIHYGTFVIDAPYASGQPIVLYVVPSDGITDAGNGFSGSLDCLIADDAGLGLERHAAR